MRKSNRERRFERMRSVHPPGGRKAHPAIVRVTHWASAFAMLCMIGSGWQIYDASPILPFTFPSWATLGGWLGGALMWHFAAMWVLMGAGAVYLGYGVASGHFRRDIRPTGPRTVWRDAVLALRFRLVHREGHYNAVQRLLYAGVLAVVVLTVLTGLSIWKPVELGWLCWLFGGYDVARRIHFALMVAIVAFLAVHLALVALVPSTLRSMITGGRLASDGAEAPR
jgi:thiosulfate reductase cytochrome b subunit